MKNPFKKKDIKQIIFTFEDAEGGYFLNVAVRGDVTDDHILGVQEFVNSKVKQAQNGKDKRKQVRRRSV